MNENFIISAFKDDKKIYLAIDKQSGGHPYWCNSMGGAAEFSLEEMDRKIKDIKSDFREERGYFFEKGIDTDNIIVFKIGIVDTKLIKVPKTAQEIKDDFTENKVKEIKETISQKDIDFIKANL